MSFLPQRQFDGVQGEPSKDTGGPDILEKDIDEINTMFNPNTTHTGGQQGGISIENTNFRVLSATAKPYSASSAYSVGEYVVYSGNVYACISTITTPEPWTAAHWSLVQNQDVYQSKINTAYTHSQTTGNPHNTDAELVSVDPITGVTGTNVQNAMENVKTQIDTKASTATVTAHTSNTSNPHSVTKAQVGLSNADNTSDLNKPVSTATQTALNAKESVSDADLLVKNVTFTPANGKFTFTKQGGGTIVIDTNIEKVPGSMALIEDPVGSGAYYLVIYDTSTPPRELSRCPVSALFNAINVEDTSTVNLVLASDTAGKKKLTANVKDGSITFAKLDSLVQGRISTLESHEIDGVTDTDTIDLGISGKKITASVKDGSITSQKLASGLYAEIEGFKTAAETAATNAAASESNASIYAGNSAASATEALGHAGDASTYAGNASTYATNASNSATDSAGYANAASGSAINANTYATNASGKAVLSESWAVGGTGTRTGEDYNNAKYWCEQASAAVSADMKKSVYDPTLSVQQAGGIPNYVAAQVPTTLAELSEDTTHRVVTDTEKSTWNAKQDALPSVTNDRYLHTNSTTGALEWAQVSPEIFHAHFLIGYPDESTSYEDVVAAFQAGKYIYATRIWSIYIDGARYPKFALVLAKTDVNDVYTFVFEYLDTTSKVSYFATLTNTGWTLSTGITYYEKPSGGIPDSDIASASTWNNKADKASITAGTAGTSSATSGSSLAVPYVTMNAQGIVTGYGTHTHTVTGFAASSHSHGAGDITSGTLGVARGGTGAATLTSGAALIGNGTGAIQTRSITNNTSKAAAGTSTNLATCNTVTYNTQYWNNRTTIVSAADTNYTTLMARGESLNSTETTPAVNGAIAWTYA